MGNERNIINGSFEEAFGYLSQSLLPIAIFTTEGNAIVLKLFSKGFMNLCDPALSRDDIMAILNENPYAFVKNEDLEEVQRVTIAFMRDEAPYDVMFRVKKVGFCAEKRVHGCGYHEYSEEGKRYSIITYEDITSYIRAEREKNSVLENTIHNLIDKDDYAIAIMAEETHELFLYNSAMESAIPPANFYTTGMTFEEYFYGSSEKRNNLFEVFIDKGDKLYVDPYTGTEMAVRVTSIDWNGKKSLYVKGSMTSEAYYDGLTGIPNKRFFLERGNVLFRQYLAQGFRPHILYMNMKSLHYYNTAFGFEEGNKILIGMALILKKAFPNQLLGRFGADHFFLLLDDEPDVNLINDIAEEIRDSGQMAIEVKFGYSEITDNYQDLTDVIDFAKTACESIKDSLDNIIIKYSDSMSEDTIMKKYVIENIDRAVARGFIKVYYQPVVRTLTGKVCGAEALARWVDPHKGVLNVGTVISALEESYQIHKLDCCIIEQVCKEYRECVDEGRTAVPISVNLSRLDFVCCDIYNSIERSRRKYSVPRNMINLEITESIFGSEASVRSVVTKFRDAGYQVWMDDFGSGYSSLNLLKEFSFDELKLDMAFLTNFSDKGKSIIKSTIDMAKDIGVYTLAEGVETEEQYEFLRKIGCEKVQGFLFERPLPYDKFIESCQKKNLELEEPIWKDYYDVIGKTSFISDKPVALVEYEEGNLKTLFANHLFAGYYDDNENADSTLFDERINNPELPFNRAITSFVQNDLDIGETYGISFWNGDKYVKVSYKCLAKCVNRFVFYISIDNISNDEIGDTHKNTNDVIRNLYYLFDFIAIVNVDDNTAEEVFSEKSFKYSTTEIINSYQEKMLNYGKNNVHEDDFDRYTQFVEISTIVDRINSSKKEMVSDYFRVKDVNGKYVWKLFTYKKMPQFTENKVEIIINEVPENSHYSDML